MPSTKRLVGLGMGLATAGVAGGLTAERAMVRAHRRRPDPAAGVDTGLDADTAGHLLTMSDGGRLRVVEQGRGPAIVLIHGITLSSAVWHEQLPALAAAGYRAVAYDQRGHGSSTPGADGISLGRLAADLGEVLDALDLGPAMVVGHSMGGMVALRWLTGGPDAATGPSGPSSGGPARGRVAALALVATSASPVVGSGLPGVRAAVAAARPLLARADWLTSRLPGPSLGRGDLGFLLARVTFGADPSASQVTLTRDVTAGVPARVSAGLLGEIVHFDEMASLRSLTLPTLVVVGTNDLMTPAGHARAMAGELADGELIVLDGCGHMVMMERAAELDAALLALAERAGMPPRRRFLGRVRRAGRP